MHPLLEKFRPGGYFTVACYPPLRHANGDIMRDDDGNVIPDYSRPKWIEHTHNIVVNVGLDYILDAAFSGGTQITTWYVGIKNTGTPVAADTMASHASWAENQNYSEANRQTWQEGGVSGQSITNSANKATFSIDTDSQSIHGAFLVSDNTKGGTSGTLACVADFSSAKAADNGDTLEVTYQLDAADDGA